MPRVMFPFSERELERRASQPELYKPKEWTRRGFFKDYKPMSRHEVALKASNARLWLEYTLHAGPKLATEIIRLAKLDGICEPSLRRAKRHHKVKSIRRGGRGTGRRNPWIWQMPVSD